MDMQATEQDAQYAYSAYRRFLAEGADLVKKEPRLAKSFAMKKAEIEDQLKKTGIAMRTASNAAAPSDGLGFLPLIAGGIAALASSTALRGIASSALSWLGAATAAAAGTAAVDAATSSAPAVDPTSQPSTTTNIANIMKYGVMGLALFIGWKIYKEMK